MMRYGYQKTSPVVLALTTVSLGGHIELLASAEWDAYELSLRGGGGWFVKTSQSPTSSGEADATYFRVAGALKWWLSTNWGLQVYGRYLRRKATYRGPNGHVDPVTDPAEPFTYDRAVETDALWLIGLGVIVSVF